MKVHLHNFPKIKSPKEVTKLQELRFFLLFLLADRRIRIHTSEKWILIREAQNHVDPEHWFLAIIVSLSRNLHDHLEKKNRYSDYLLQCRALKNYELSIEIQPVLSCGYFRFWEHGLQAAERQKAGTTPGGSHKMTGWQPLYKIKNTVNCKQEKES